MKKCIYCDRSESDGIIINESHIIPDALCNKEIKYKNVCSIEHNKIFGDTFEFDIIEKCRRITHHLNIRNKENQIMPYKADIEINGYRFRGYTSKFQTLLSGKTIPLTKDNRKYLFKYTSKGEPPIPNRPYELLNELNFSEDLEFMPLCEMLKSKSMLRLVAKISYEWFCKINKINGFQSKYKNIVNYIVNEESMENIVSVVENTEFLKQLNDHYGHGAHVLAIYDTSPDKNTYVIFSFFGLVTYKTQICKNAIQLYNSIDNVLYYIIRSDGICVKDRVYNNTDKFEYLFKSNDPQKVIIQLQHNIAENYSSMMSHQSITLKTIRPYVTEIEKVLKRTKGNKDNLTLFIGSCHLDVIAELFVMYNVGLDKEIYKQTDSFDKNIRRIFNDVEKVTVSKNMREYFIDEIKEDHFVDIVSNGISIIKIAYQNEVSAQ